MKLLNRLPAALVLLPPLLLCPALDPAVGQQIDVPEVRNDTRIPINLALCGTLTTDRVLVSSSEPYVLCRSGASVTGGATLAIEPGVTIVAEPGAALRVRTDSVLRAIGSEADPILFAGVDPTPGSWTGIWLESSAQENELSWVEIAHGGTSSYANLYLDQSASIRISNSTFRDAGTWGVHVADSSVSLPDFRANRFHGNSLSPIRMFANQMRWIDGDSRFTGNGQDLIEIRQGTLSGDPHVWRRTTVPFLLAGSVSVDTRLEVQPGFRLLAADGAGSIRIRRDGSISAVGTADQPIRFTSASGEPGAWSGLWIESDRNNELRFVEIAHGGRGSLDNIYLGSGATVTVENSVIRNGAAYGINVASGTATVAQTGNFFQNNASGDLRLGAEVMTLGGVPQFAMDGGSADTLAIERPQFDTSTLVPQQPTIARTTDDESIDSGWTGIGDALFTGPIRLTGPDLLAALSGRFRIVANGFHTARHTRDRNPGVPGAGDDIMLMFVVMEFDRDGRMVSERIIESDVFGSVQRFPRGVRAGTASAAGGLQSGDPYPNSSPWRRSREPGDSGLPMTVWEGALLDGGNHILVMSSVWRRDPGLRSDFFNALDEQRDEFIAELNALRARKLLARCTGQHADLMFAIDMGRGFGDFYVGDTALSGFEASYFPVDGSDDAENVIRLEGAHGSIYLNRSRSLFYFRDGPNPVDFCNAQIEEIDAMSIRFDPDRLPAPPSAATGGERIVAQCSERNPGLGFNIDTATGFADLTLVRNPLFALTAQYRSSGPAATDHIEVAGDTGHPLTIDRTASTLLAGAPTPEQICTLQLRNVGAQASAQNDPPVRTDHNALVSIGRRVLNGWNTIAGEVRSVASVVGRATMRAISTATRGVTTGAKRVVVWLATAISGISSGSEAPVYPHERPIGLAEDGNSLDYAPHVLHLDFVTADMLRRQDIGRGPGVLTISHQDSNELGGYYMVYLQLERLD